MLEELVISYLRKAGQPQTVKELASHMSGMQASVQAIIRRLLVKGVVEHTGHRRGLPRYRLKDGL
jgi:predicted transcriptional regulator